jgi:uncharacterized membrane protein YkoI
MKRNLILPAAFVGLSATVLAAAYAAKPAENDGAAIATAKISLAQAVSAAETHVGGKAARAEFEKSKGQWVFDVEVVKGAVVTDVAVDANSGKVLSATEDKADSDDDQDKED